MSDGPLICAFKMDGRGGGEPLSWGQLSPAVEPGQFTWIHLDRTHEEAQAWLRGEAGLDPIVVDALLAEETRPRCTDHDGGLLLNLRGVNHNPDADPEDMLSIRLWVTKDRIITARRYRLLAINDLRQAVEAGRGPATPGFFVSALASRLLYRMGMAISELDDELDGIEEEVITTERARLRGALANLRRQAITFRRHVAPQRDALSRLVTIDTPLLEKQERNRARESFDDVNRQVELLDEIRERASVIQDELTTRLSDQMNKRLYVLSIVSAIFLPLNLFAGMLGMNVAGVPGLENENAFVTVTAALVVVGVIEYALMRWLKWI